MNEKEDILSFCQPENLKLVLAGTMNSDLRRVPFHEHNYSLPVRWICAMCPPAELPSPQDNGTAVKMIQYGVNDILGGN